MKTRLCWNRKQSVANISLTENNKVFLRFSATVRKVWEIKTSLQLHILKYLQNEC